MLVLCIIVLLPSWTHTAVIFNGTSGVNSPEVRTSERSSEITSEPMLPEADQSLESILKTGRLLVDKIEYLEKLMSDYRFRYTLSRPHGFGKTIFLQLLRKFFRGEKDFFKGTSIYHRGNEKEYTVQKAFENKEEGKWVEYPLIYLNFADIVKDFNTSAQFGNNLKEALNAVALSYDLQEKNHYNYKRDNNVNNLIRSLHWKLKLDVVILIDEYDAPTNHALYVRKNQELASKISRELGSFFQCLKNSIEIRFVLVTGVLVLDFQGVNGGLDVFTELTPSEFAEAFGFTQGEIRKNFNTHIEQFSRRRNQSTEDTVQQLHEWYGNYNYFSFCEPQLNPMINPTSAIRCLKEGRFSADHICANHSMLYLAQKFYDDNYCVDDFVEGIYDFDRYFRYKSDPNLELPVVVYMVMHGFLTIKNCSTNEYEMFLPGHTGEVMLDYPNRSVKEALKNRLQAYVPCEKAFIEDLPEWNEKLQKYMQIGDIPNTMNVIAQYEFYPITSRSLTEAYPAEITSRITAFFRSSNIEYKILETTIVKYTDVQTLNLPTNYILRTAYEREALPALGQLVRQMNKKPNEPKILKDVYLIVMKFTKLENDRIKLSKWISVSYKNGEMQCHHLQASSSSMLKEARSKYCAH